MNEVPEKSDERSKYKGLDGKEKEEEDEDGTY